MTWLRAQWDRAGAAGLCGLGVVLLVVGWFGVSNTTYAAEQIPWVISCGIGGLFCLGVAAVLWLSADLQDEWRKLDALEAVVRESAPVAAEAVSVAPAVAVAAFTPVSPVAPAASAPAASTPMPPLASEEIVVPRAAALSAHAGDAAARRAARRQTRAAQLSARVGG